MLKWMQNILGYCDRKKIVVNLCCNIPSYLLVRPFIQSKGRGWGRSLFQPTTEFTFLQNMKIWCTIQVIINPLMLIFFNQDGNYRFYLHFCISQFFIMRHYQKKNIKWPSYPQSYGKKIFIREWEPAAKSLYNYVFRVNVNLN